MAYKLKPYVLAIRTTERCNVGCFHCSISACPTGSDIQLEIAKQAIQESSDYGIRLVHLSGGEPLLYRHLIELITVSQKAGMIAEIVTSTFTNPGETNLKLLSKCKNLGLYCIMVSYDDAHARRVSFDQFSDFIRIAQEEDLNICIFVTENERSEITARSLSTQLSKNRIEVEKITFCKSTICYTGRSFSSGSIKLLNYGEQLVYLRCPYVMPVPTLTPNGAVMLCPCAVLNTDKFILGYFPAESLQQIFKRFENQSIYKLLSCYGPQACLELLGIDKGQIPVDLCQACEKYLQVVNLDSYQQKANILFRAICQERLFVDFEALLPPHKKYLTDCIG